ncbi:hypothetical protein A2Y85_07850 [candidate division WOR-3 bacterium RBG_13_43_14]|uniref:Secretion system C-terminal sorting domain-containing protein n=1 Tax=candidate division WOR-3 bacterium RBG_13_43_14 TaxID=1802590 RepID=A0A1F4UEU5_UNCW3|nr:MAG: hypothetical protein A2Y85_07850 [candidate division WOR-3 bacterium RBG_13_43_14]
MILIFLLINRVTFSPYYYTNTNYIYELAAGPDRIYAATNGGLISYDELDQNFEVITNTDGLLTNCQKCLAIDSSGYIWSGSDVGLSLVSSDWSRIAVYPSDCLTGVIIQDIVCRRDSVYIGSAGGMLFINTNGTPNDFSDDMRTRIFEEMGGLISNNVRSIAVTADHVWAGTDRGISRFTKNFDPDSTRNYTTLNGLLNNYVNKIAVIDTFIYVASDSGLNRFNGIDFDSLVLHRKVVDVVQVGDSLGLALDSVSQFGFYYNNDLIIRNLNLYSRSKPRSLLYTIDGSLYCGLGNRWVDDKYGDGFGRYDFSANAWLVIQHRCLPLNQISDIAATEQGIFTACSDRSSQYARGLGWLHDDDTWTNFNRDTILSTNLIHRCKQAPDGKIWLGVNTFSSSGQDTMMMFSFDPAADVWTSYPGGFLNMDATVAVWDLEFDASNNMYLSLAGGANRLYAIDSALTMAYYIAEKTVGFFVEIAIDSIGRVWLSRLGDTKGMLRIDTKNTLFDRNDDMLRTFGVSEGLAYGNCYGSIVDQQGALYIANDKALVKFANSFSTVYSNPDDEFFDLELDSWGRVWAMARHGLYCYDPILETIDQYEYEDLHVDVDFLPTSNEVIQLQGFEFDSLRHCFWIGNNNGLLKLTIENDPVTVIDSVIIYPNPAINRDDIHIKRLPIDAQVNIYTISGRLMAEGLVPDPVFNEIIWHLPENISSGLYYAVIHSNHGRKVLKFAIVR